MWNTAPSSGRPMFQWLLEDHAALGCRDREEVACWEEEVEVLSQRSVQSLHNGSRGLYRLVQVAGVEAGGGSISFLSCENGG